MATADDADAELFLRTSLTRVNDVLEKCTEQRGRFIVRQAITQTREHKGDRRSRG